MNIRDFYNNINSSLDEMLERVGTEERALKYVRMFKLDPSYSELVAAIEANDLTAAFRSIHTLKGVSANLGFSSLYEVSVVLTEILRNYSGQDFSSALADVKEKYTQIIDLIGQLD